MAILWWIATGTQKKMESDVAFKYTGKAFWARQLTQGEVPLETNHVQLQFAVLGCGVILSTLVFFGELLQGTYRKLTVKKLLSVSTIQVKKRKNAINNGPDVSQSKSRSNVSNQDIVTTMSG